MVKIAPFARDNPQEFQSDRRRLLVAHPPRQCQRLSQEFFRPFDCALDGRQAGEIDEGPGNTGCAAEFAGKD